MSTQVESGIATLSRRAAKAPAAISASARQVLDRLDRAASVTVRSAVRKGEPSVGGGQAAATNPGQAAALDTIQIALIDEHPLYRDGVAMALTRMASFQVVAEGSTRDDAIRIARDFRPALMLIDVDISGDGIEAAAEINRLYPTVKIVFLTASDDNSAVFKGLQAGGRGYVVKGIGAQELTDMLNAVHRGETVVSPGLAGRLLAAGIASPKTPFAHHVALTTREDEIMDRVSAGLTNKEVARVLGLTEKTVKHYMTNIMQKLQVRNRVEAALAHKSTARAAIA